MSPQKTKISAVSAPPESKYPTTESLIETATAEEIGALFASLREALSTLKGPRAESGKKVAIAIDHVEALHAHLIQIREKLEVEQGSAKGGRR